MNRMLPVLLFLVALGCSSGTPEIPSPDGLLKIVTSVERNNADPAAYRCVILEIRDAAGRVIFRENTRASDTHRWSLTWISNDRIRLESSDIGTYCWSRQADNSWKKEL